VTKPLTEGLTKELTKPAAAPGGPRPAGGPPAPQPSSPSSQQLQRELDAWRRAFPDSHYSVAAGGCIVTTIEVDVITKRPIDERKELARLRRIENAALRVASSRRPTTGIVVDGIVLDALDEALEKRA
jgi:hypothetical protein